MSLIKMPHSFNYDVLGAQIGNSTRTNRNGMQIFASELNKSAKLTGAYKLIIIYDRRVSICSILNVTIQMMALATSSGNNRFVGLLH